MKEDYLWNKTGKDADIEKLENALLVFRCRDVAPPALPVKSLQLKIEPPRKVFPLAFAFAAGLALAVSAGIWFSAVRENPEMRNELTTTATSQNEIASPAQTPDRESSDLPAANVPKRKQSAGRKVIKSKASVPVNIEREKTIARHKKPMAQDKSAGQKAIELTKEERYAYEQLMLALSITSSKLKQVKDKVEGVEEQNSVLETEDKNIRRN